MNRLIETQRTLFIFALGLLAAFAGPAPAADFYWLNASDGDFGSANNWTDSPNGPPGASDNANFDLQQGSPGYTVTFSVPVVNAGLVVYVDHVTLDLDGHQYTVNDVMSVGFDNPALSVLTILNDTLVANTNVQIGSIYEAANAELIVGVGATLEVEDIEIGGDVGITAEGTLTVQDGGTVIVDGDRLRLANGDSGTGTLNVTGASSTLTCTAANGIRIGNRGVGECNITAGGHIITDSILVGWTTGSDATLTVDGASILDVNAALRINNNGGDGVVDVTNGGTINSDGVRLSFAGAPGGTAALTVSGTGSTLNNTGEVEIGIDSTATVDVHSGGLFDVQNPEPYIVGPLGIVTVGANGTLKTGGSVTPGGTTTIGTAAGGTGELRIDGTGALWQGYGPVHIGTTGGVGLVVIDNGGVFEVQDPTPFIVGSTAQGDFSVLNGSSADLAGDLIVGDAAGSLGDVELKHADSTLDVTGSLTVGSEGDATFEITTGGMLTVADTTLGEAAGSTGYLLVQGSESGMDSPGEMIIGESGEGTLEVTNGALLTSGAATMGQNAGSMGSALVTGFAGSTWQIDGSFTMGVGETSILTVQNGGLFEHQDPTPFIVGPNSTVNINNQGVIRSGGSASPGGTTTIGSAAGGTADINIDGAGSVWETYGPTEIGTGGPATLTLTTGGAFDQDQDPVPYIVGPFADIDVLDGTVTSNGPLTIGSAAGGTADVEIAAAGRWDAFNSVAVGDGGPGSLNVNGGVFEVQDPEPLIVGPDAVIEINAGGILRSGGSATPGGTTTIGSAAGGTADINIDGAGSVWETYGPTEIGTGGPATVTLTTGGAFEQVQDPSPYIVGPFADIDVLDGTVTSNGPLTIGSAAGGTALVGINEGRWDAFNSVTIGGAGPGSLSIISAGSGALFRLMGPDSFTVGPDGDVAVHGDLHTGGWNTPGGTTKIGSSPGSTASINVGGSGIPSRWEIAGPTSIGEDGPGTVSASFTGVIEQTDPFPFNVGPDGQVALHADGALITRGATKIGTDYEGESYISPAKIYVPDAARWDNYDALEIGGSGLAHIFLEDSGTIEDHGAASCDLMLDASVFGTGTMTGDFESVGRLYPGESPGTLTITGNYTQLAQGELIIEIDGGLAGEFDVVNISGTATLDGKLIIDRDFTYTPSLSDTFTIMTFASLSGTFAQVDSPPFIGAGAGLTFRVDYNANDVTLTVVEDCNFNGVPDSEELAACAGDPNCDDCNSNGVLDVCDIDTCDRAVDPDCADCNNNDIPDLCDLTGVCTGGASPPGTTCQTAADCTAPDTCDGAFSEDDDTNNIPDECVFFTGGGATMNWTDGDNWDLAGDHPDNDAVEFHVTIDGAGSDVVLDADITIDTLNLLGGATLEVSGGDLTVLADKGIEINGDTPGLARMGVPSFAPAKGGVTMIDGRSRVLYEGFSDAGALAASDHRQPTHRDAMDGPPYSGTQMTKDDASAAGLRSALPTRLTITGSNTVAAASVHAVNSGELLLADSGILDVSGNLIIGAGGKLEKELAASNVSATILADSVEINPGSCASSTNGGELSIDDDMSLTVTNNLVVNGSLETLCPPLRGILPPPKLSIGCGGGALRLVPAFAVSGDLLISNAARIFIYAGCGSRGLRSAVLEEFRVTGNVINKLTKPFAFDWTNAGVELSESAIHSFEVAGRDLGPEDSGLALQDCALSLQPCETPAPTCGSGGSCEAHTNGTLGSLRIGDSATVTFVDQIDNENWVRGAPEALYVETLYIGTATTVTVDGCSVYYRSVVPPEAEALVMKVNGGKFEKLPTTIGPALAAPAPHDRRKNRYISFDPNKAENDGMNVAFKVELTSINQGSCDDATGGDVDFCRIDRGAADCNSCVGGLGGTCINTAIHCSTGGGVCTPTGATCVNDTPNSGGSNVGQVWWVGPEHPSANGVHLLVSAPFRKESANWGTEFDPVNHPGEYVVHVGDCEVVPQATYGIRAVDVAGGSESAELVVETTTFPPTVPPAQFWWADAIGALQFFCNGDITSSSCTVETQDADCGPGIPCLRAWTLPNGIVNFDDVNAALTQVSPPGVGVPAEKTLVDLHPLGGDGPPNFALNASDLQQFIFGFGGFPYTGYDPADCPDAGNWP